MEEINMCKNEYINYSNYKSNETIQIDQYISDVKSGVFNCIASAKSGEKSLLISQTGSGKTYTIIQSFKEFNIKSIFIVPNATNVEQIMREYDIPGAYGDLGAEVQLEKGNVVVMTWDKFSQLKNVDLSEYVAIVDEIHQTFTDMYRDEKIKGLYNNLDYCKGRIDITATPNKLDFNVYDYIVEYEPRIQTKYNVKLYNKIDDNVVIDIINKSNKAALLKDDTKYLEYMKASSNKKAELVTSSLKDTSKVYFDIVNDSTISKIDLLLNTSVIVAGVNINEPGITDIVVIGIKDIATIKQYVARFRGLEEVNVHVFNNNYNEDISNTYEIEWLVGERIKETQYVIDKFNSINKMEFKTQALGLRAFKLDNSTEYYYDNEAKEYKLNIPGIRHTCYMNYYNKADILSFKELLHEYFENIETVDLSEPNNDDRKEFNKLLKEDKEAAIELIEADKDILVGANELLRGKSSSKLERYFRENRLDKDKILEQINEKCIPSLIRVGNIKKIIDLHTKYVIENNFNYELSWYLANKGNESKKIIFNQMNIQVFRRVKKNYPQLIDNHIVENKIYEFLTDAFKPGISYTKEHIEYFIEAIETFIPGTKLTEKEIRKKLQNIYIIECKNTKLGTGLQYNFYNNIVPRGVPSKSGKMRIYTIKGYKKIADIIEEHQLSEVSKKSLDNIIKTRVQKIINSNEAQEILSIENIFVS